MELLKGGGNSNLNKLATGILVPLMVISAILAETIFKSLQVASELILLILFSFLLIRNNISKYDFTILIIYILANFITIFYLSPTTVMLNIKQFGLPILALMYFRKNTQKSIFLPLAFIFCIILMITQKLVGHFPIPINSYITTLKDDFEGRPLGLFLNYHFSAFFVAVFLIGVTFKKSIFFIDYVILFFFNVQTSLISYLGQKVYYFIFKRFKQPSLSKVVIFFLSFLFIFLFVVRSFLDFLDVPEAAISGLVIFYQLTDINTYTRILYLFPRDIYEFYNLSLYNYSGTKVDGYFAEGNEISFIQIIVQGGLILGISFLSYILKNISIYRIFILLSLIHYSYLFSPLIIYTMCYFDNKNKFYHE